jgi:hypothetical protein
MKHRRNIGALAVCVVLAASAVLAQAASASPVWKFNGTELTSKETVVGAAISSHLTIPGATTECAHFLYNMKIYNSSGAGKGEITELPLYECKTSSGKCTVESIGATKLPWPTHLSTVSSSEYLIVEGVTVNITYSGALCALAEEVVQVKGSAGGIINNTAQTATFDKATFEATKTELKVGSGSVEWAGEFPTEAFESHREQALEA